MGERRPRLVPTGSPRDQPRLAKPAASPDSTRASADAKGKSRCSSSIASPPRAERRVVEFAESADERGCESDYTAPEIPLRARGSADSDGVLQGPIVVHHNTGRGRAKPRATSKRKDCPRKSELKTPPRGPSLRELYVEAYAQRGLSTVDIERLAQNWQQKTRQRYESGWNHFLAVAVHPGRLRASLRDFLHDLQSTPLCQVVAWLAEVCDAASGSVARNAYSALLLLPCCHQLRYEPTMTPLKRRWNKNSQRYDEFYDIEPLLQKMLDAP